MLKYLAQILLAAAAVCSFGPAAWGAIILHQTSLALPYGGLVQYTINAIGTAGEVINVFSAPSLTPARETDLGVHNVAAYGFGEPVMTPTRQQHLNSATPFNDDWAAYDTYFLYPQSQLLELGPPFAETNDGSTIGTLGLSTAYGAEATSGFGTYSSHAWSAKGVLRNYASSNIPFMQVVMREGDLAHLNINVISNTGLKRTFTDYVIGAPDPPYVPEPEPVVPPPIEPEPQPIIPPPVIEPAPPECSHVPPQIEEPAPPDDPPAPDDPPEPHDPPVEIQPFPYPGGTIDYVWRVPGEWIVNSWLDFTQPVSPEFIDWPIDADGSIVAIDVGAVIDSGFGITVGVAGAPSESELAWQSLPHSWAVRNSLLGFGDFLDAQGYWVDGQLGAAQLVSAPEPSSVVLASLLLITMAAFRRRAN
ncbi:MAG: hypothetical protein WD738_06595 [Pirellulales bacterium]